jgi:hypothetical protein
VRRFTIQRKGGRTVPNEPSQPVMAWLLGVSLLLIFGVPLAWSLYRRIERAKRRRLERSKRPVRVRAARADVPIEAEGCSHKRSRSRAREQEDGTLHSVCRFCGAPMKRVAAGEWKVLEPAPAPDPRTG